MWHGDPCQRQAISARSTKRVLQPDAADLVRVDSTVSTVSASVGVRCLLDNDLLDNEVFKFEFVGDSVGLGVDDEVEEELCRLCGPSTCFSINMHPSDPALAVIDRP